MAERGRKNLAEFWEERPVAEMGAGGLYCLGAPRRAAVVQEAKMHGTLEHLRGQNPGKWLLIRLDGPEAETGELVAAHEDPAMLDKLVMGGGTDRSRPLYLTYSIPEGKPLPAAIL